MHLGNYVWKWMKVGLLEAAGRMAMRDQYVECVDGTGYREGLSSTHLIRGL